MLLSPFELIFVKDQSDWRELLRFVKPQSDHLPYRISSAPACIGVPDQCGFYRMSSVLGRYIYLYEFLHVEPYRVIGGWVSLYRHLLPRRNENE